MKNMKIKKDKNEEMKVISHQTIIQNWEKEFEEILKQKQEKTLELFPIDKEWFDNYKNSVLSNNISIGKKIENYHTFLPFDNSNILHDKNSINPISNFIFLNQASMDSFSHYIMKKKQFNIKILARFFNGKMVSKIGKQLYYFYFVDNNNDIKEGFLIFGNLDIQLINSIIIDFQKFDVNLFLNYYFDNKPVSNEKAYNEKLIIYHRNEFDLFIKNNNTNSFKKNNLKKISMPKNIKSISNGIYISTKKIHQINSNNKNMKDINYISNNSFKSNGALNENNPSDENNKYYELKSHNFYNFPKFRNFDFGSNKINSNIRSNLVECIFQYYYSEEMLKQFINNKGQFKIFQMINNSWFENFKDKIDYNQIKSILNDKESGQFKKIIQDYINNNNLNNIIIGNIPTIKKNYINGKTFYYNDYQLLNQSCFSQFYKSFNKDYQKNKEFETSNLDNKNIFVKYSKDSGEILNYNNQNIEHMYIIESENHLDDILNTFKKYGLEDGLKKYGVDITNYFGQQKTLKINNSEKIGIIIFLNNQNNNTNIISSDEEIIKNEENVFDNTLIRKESRNKNYINDINTPKIIKKRKVLHKSNLKNSGNRKEDKTFDSFKTPNINHKSMSKFNFNNENNNNYVKTSSNHLNNNENLNKTMTNLKYLQKSNSNIFFEPNNNSKKLNFSNSIHSKSPQSRNSKRGNNNQNISKFNSNQIKISNKNLGLSKPINFKNKSKSSKIPNEEKYASPSFNSKKTKEIYPSKKQKRYIRPPSFPKEETKNNELKKQYEINPKLKNNKNFLSPKEPKKRCKIKLPIKPPVYEEQIQYDNNQNTPGLTGLQNIGATCYMNATLQCLSNTQRFREGILKLNKNNSQNKELSYSLKEVLVNLWKNDKIKYYAPYNFKNLIGQMNPLFKGVQANDSKDLILFILETIHRELNIKKESIPEQSNVNNLDFNSVFNQFTTFYKANNQSIVSDEFYGYFVSIMKCGYCNAVTYNVQIMNILIFPLEKVRIYMKNQYNFVTLDDCFRNYEEPELLAGSDQIYCNKCNMTTNAYNHNKLIISPKTIIINLNRGKGLEFKVGIKFEEYMDIKKYLLMSDKSPNYYELVGVISHFGGSDMSGHFIAYCKNSFDGKWYKFNDAMVNLSSFQEASSIGIPYVLFYSYIEN